MTYDGRFEALWDRMWIKKAKFAAYKLWVNLCDGEKEEIERVFEAHRAHYAQRDPEFRPHFRKWLYGRQWEDELENPLPKQEEVPDWMKQGDWNQYPRRVQ